MEFGFYAAYNRKIQFWSNPVGLFDLNFKVKLALPSLHVSLEDVSNPTVPSLTIYALSNLWDWSCFLQGIFSPGEGNGNPLQYSCLENPTDGGARQATVRGVKKSRTRLSDFTFTFRFHALKKEMATHSSALAWRTPVMGELGGLPSMGSHRVGHDWSNLAVKYCTVIF